jgi:hypothetical protein
MDDPGGHVERVPSNSQAQPDQTGVDPNLSPASRGSSGVAPQAVAPSYSSASTQSGGSQQIPQGLQDLVRDYFNADPAAQAPNGASSQDQPAPPSPSK